MKSCYRCLTPKTRPGLVGEYVNYGEFEAWTCQACLNFDKRQEIDWDDRAALLTSLCNEFREESTPYDVVCPVSGGKDSHFIVKTMKDRGMNPLLVTVKDPFTSTEAGISNLNNLKETFNCDSIAYELGRDTFRRATRTAFEELGAPLYYIEYAIYTVPVKIAQALGIGLVMFGENSAYEYGTTTMNTEDALPAVRGIINNCDRDFWLKKAKLQYNELYPIEKFWNPRSLPEVRFMSYYYPWSSIKHREIAKRYGFKDITHEWQRENTIEHFEQIDSYAYLFYLWMKYPKFGFQRVTDIVSRRIREGLMDRDEGMKLILEKDHQVDQLSLFDFADFCGYSVKEVYDIVDRHYNTDLFEKSNGTWKLKEPRF